MPPTARRSWPPCACNAPNGEGEDIGYWRGPSLSPLAHAPLALLDNEGQFSICGSPFAETVLSRTYDEEQFTEPRDWFRSLGIEVRAGPLGDLTSPPVELAPDKLHRELDHRYLGGSPDFLRSG